MPKTKTQFPETLATCVPEPLARVIRREADREDRSVSEQIRHDLEQVYRTPKRNQRVSN